MDAEELKLLLELVPLSFEGGYFSESYRSADLIPQGALPGRSTTVRSDQEHFPERTVVLLAGSCLRFQPRRPAAWPVE